VKNINIVLLYEFRHMYMSLHNTPIPTLARIVRNLEAVGPSSRNISCAFAQTTLSKGSPELTGVGTTGQGPVGIDDGITSLDEVGVAGLQSHTIHDELHCEVFACDS
jgi:hypothetical protein